MPEGHPDYENAPEEGDDEEPTFNLPDPGD